MIRVPSTTVAGFVLMACLGACSKVSDLPATAPIPDAGSWRFLELRQALSSEGLQPAPCPAQVALVLALASRDEGAVPRAGLRVLLGCDQEDTPGMGVTVRASVEMAVSEPRAPEDLYQGFGRVDCADCFRTESTFALWQATTTAIRLAVDEAVAQHGLMKATDREVLDRLERPEAWPRVVLLAAIEEAGTRRLNDATPWCIRLLSHADTEIVLRSMGTLGRIGNPSALKPLGRLALSPSPEIPHVAVRVIADIGGPEARRVLELIRDQAGHSLVGKEASEAISDMEHGGE